MSEGDISKAALKLENEHISKALNSLQSWNSGFKSLQESGRIWALYWHKASIQKQFLCNYYIM
jgi:hypothetical protein